MNASRQRRWQLEQRAVGNCTVCGKPAGGRFKCREHADRQNELAFRKRCAAKGLSTFHLKRQ